MHLLRTLLFVPVVEPRFLAKAHLRGADAVILDLEDSIAPARKDEARRLVKAASAGLSGHGVRVFVRINSGPERAGQDIAASVCATVSGLFIPKVETSRQLGEREEQVARSEIQAGLPDRHTSLVAMLETPRAIFNALSIAESSRRLVAVAFGGEDFAAAMEVPTDSPPMTHAAQVVAMAARAAGIQALGLPGSIAEFSDLQEIKRIARLARQMGYTGSPCIHPDQVGIFNEAFGVTEADAADAGEIVRLYEKYLSEGLGAVAFRGRMIDIPVYQRALAIQRRARLIAQSRR